MTTDCWTTLTDKCYIKTNVTCHFIDADWEMQSSVLLTQNLFVQHSSDNLGEKLSSNSMEPTEHRTTRKARIVFLAILCTFSTVNWLVSG